METLQDAYRDDEEESETTPIDPNPNPDPVTVPDPNPDPPPTTAGEPPSMSPPISTPEPDSKPDSEPDPMHVETAALATNAEPEANAASDAEPMAVELAEIPESAGKVEPLASEDLSSDSISEGKQNDSKDILDSEVKRSEGEDMEEDEATTTAGPALKKQKSLSLDEIDATPVEIATPSSAGVVANGNGNGSKKSSKKKSKGCNSVWTKPTSRKGKKKAKNGGNNNNQNNGSSHTPLKTEDAVHVTPVPRCPDKNDDSPEAKICLSKVYKAEKVELGEDRLSAGSCKGYRMVRATRGVSEGVWFFEIKVVHLGESGHTRLGWSTEKGDLQAPVGYDGNSFGYRDIDGSKVHKALREKYGEEGYKEGDVIGFYISLPEGDSFAPKEPHLVLYKGQKYVCATDSKAEPPKSVPGSEISFFKNGVCQGVAFKDLCGGRYYPAASMYTLPNQPNCVVKFNFGPDFECFPTDFEGRPVPRPMIEVPYHGFDNRVENGVSDENKQ